eukprot:TRINITY_DN534_c5_g1_i4.p1 TRINITY_DN534_c5_g1~~TRINITY_DN534_c5_g1_i4.p1  ORF type:complete len:415 (-),score=141.21 TRINITY_DN534_c5_g1_i4:23-1267(-)
MPHVCVSREATGSYNLQLIPGRGVAISLQGATMQLQMNWQYHGPLGISGSGSATDYVVMNVNFLLALGYNGNLQVSVQDVNVGITNLEIVVQGGASWFYQIMVDILHSKLSGIFSSTIASEMSTTVTNTANYYLSHTPTSFALSDDVVLDYQLTAAPDVQSSFSTSQHQGQFLDPANPQLCNLDSGNLPDFILNSHALTFVLSQSMVGCLGNLLIRQNKLAGTITSQMVPKNSPVQLETSDVNLKKIVPGLFERYPFRPLNLNVSASQSPNLNITANQPMLVNGYLNVQVEVETVSGNLIPVFGIAIQADFQVEAQIQSGNLTGSLTLFNQNTTITWTNVGPVDDTGIFFLTKLFLSAIISLVNQHTQIGIPIPKLHGIQFSDSVVVPFDGYLGVGTNFNFSPENIHNSKTFST